MINGPAFFPGIPGDPVGIFGSEIPAISGVCSASLPIASCLNREGPTDLPKGPTDLSRLPAGQHEWNDSLGTDDHGNHVSPRHHLLLYLDYTQDGQPSPEDRQTIEQAFRSLDHAYQRENEGLLFTVGYSPTYFERFEIFPEVIDLPQPTALAPFENPAFDTPDTVLHLASDYGSVVLEAEQALFGDIDTLNDVEMNAMLTGVFERADRRTGFTGKGLPAEHQDVAGIPDSEPVSDDAPLYMGFKSNFKRNQASEERVTIQKGPFADGTTQHVSLIRLHLQQWYEQDSRHHRVATMFCPAHADQDLVEGSGENLGDSSKMTEQECPAHAKEHAHEHGIVGHSRKTARARENNNLVIMRRDFNSTDDDTASLHFLSLQRTISDFVDTREAMNGTDLSKSGAVGQRTNNGILQYMTVERRGNYLLPPRSLRALPPAQP